MMKSNKRDWHSRDSTRMAGCNDGTAEMTAGYKYGNSPEINRVSSVFLGGSYLNVINDI